MKKISTILILLMMIFVSCSQEDGNLLNHDSDNFSAPNLPAGTHTVGAKFNASDLDRFVGRSLEEIHFYMVNVPDNVIIEVFGEGDFSTPGSVLVSEDIGSNMASNSWNAFILDNPIEITGDELWLCITLTNLFENSTIGCDPGPANQNGNWIQASGSNTWETFEDFTSGATSINWNIRGVLAEI